MSGKGSKRRPTYLPLTELAARWDATFGGKYGTVKAVPLYDDPRAPLTLVSLAPATTSPSPSAPDERPTE